MGLPLSGGCPCGVVRYRLEAVGAATICHCRMCQKAFGGPFTALVEVHLITWTRGARALFQSSATNRRGLCGACGTPLTYEADDILELALGTLEDPEALPPRIGDQTHGRLGWTEGLGALPSSDPAKEARDLAWSAQVVSYQHPDHDTENVAWPPGAPAPRE
ncbi:MAG: GFA family protein [Shimia sp.]